MLRCYPHATLRTDRQTDAIVPACTNVVALVVFRLEAKEFSLSVGLLYVRHYVTARQIITNFGTPENKSLYILEPNNLRFFLTADEHE